MARAFTVFLISMTLISLELVWTRIFSAEFFYAFAFLTLSLAVLGLGLGALSLRLVSFLNRPWISVLALSFCGAFALGGPPALFYLGLDFSALFASWGMAARFAAALVVLGSAFFFGGIALAGYFKKRPQELPRLYMADLLGAGAGVVVSLVLMNTAGTPAAAAWVAVPVFVAALLAGRGWLRALPLILLTSVWFYQGAAQHLLEADREERAPVIYKHWDAMSKIKVFDYNGQARGINIDNIANTPVLGFDGDWESLDDDSTGIEWDIDVEYLIRQFDDCVFLSLGSGGGWDVLQALDHGAKEVHAVEVNGHILRMMMKGDPSGYIVRDSSVTDSTGRLITMPEFSGGLYLDPRVIPVAEDARTYVRRHQGAFDVIFSLSSNTWAALGSGSFALAENYLFTQEAFVDYWNALTEDGFLSMEHQVYMPRLVSEVVHALTAVGIARPEDHFAVYNFPSLRRNVLLVSKRPLTHTIRHLAYGELTPEVFSTRHLLYPPADSLKHNLINRIVENGWRSEADSATINLSPCTDDRPFVAQMGLLRNLDREKLKNISKYAEFRGFPLSKVVIGVVLAVVLLLALPLNLLPYAGSGAKLRAGPWLYFFLIGAAFMAVEVVLIQRYTLFVGASVYSIAVVLFTLLIASGIGSRCAMRVNSSVAFFMIALCLVLEVFVLRGLTNSLVQFDLAFRVAVSILLVFPLGFFMGMPFPKGGVRVGHLVDWGFAVNGLGSVLGATCVLLLTFALGFKVALLVAAFFYCLAYLLLRYSSWESASKEGR